MRFFAPSLNPKDTVSNKGQHPQRGVCILSTNLFYITKRIGAFAAPAGVAVNIIPKDEERMTAETVCCVLDLDRKKES
jgi:hypothetical protein